MVTINDAYINALLADATYVNGLTPGLTESDLATALSGRLTAPLAKFIAANFTVVTQVGGLASSFEATVWRGNAGTPYEGQTYVSTRGTQEGTDFAQDADLATSGLAHAQLVDMVNWWLRETTPTNQTAKQIGLVFVPGVLPGTFEQVFVTAPNVQGTATLAGVGLIKSVNGHSLGGYLATAFVRLFGNQQPPMELNTFNSAGYSRLATANIESSFNQIAQLIGGGLGLAGFSGAQHNYFAENGINVTTNTWDPVGFQQYGTRIGLFQENLTPNVYDNHCMYKLTDLLALGNAMAKLDSTLDLTKLSTLVKTASSQMVDSYENLLDALRKLLMGANVTATPPGDTSAGNAGPQPVSRTTFHENLVALQATPEFKVLADGTGSIRFLTEVDRDTLVSKAKNDFGDFLAVRYLLPFALENSWGVLGTIHPDLYAQYVADKALTPQQRDAGQANYSDEYLADRAAMLTWKLKLNTKDIATSLTFPHEDVLMSQWQYFKDCATGEEIVLGNPPGGQADRRQLLFGSDQGNLLPGQDKDDRLYGMGGNDTLDGGKGNDYLEGNADDDSLKGGEGNDMLVGGAGNDTYKFTAGDGQDWIDDSDGQGHIEYDGATLGSAEIKKVADNVWQETSNGKTITYSLYDGSEGGETFKVLSIAGGNGGLWVKRWQPGSLGITLPEASAVTPPSPDKTIVGDLAPIDTDLAESGIQYGYDDLGNVLTSGAKPGRADTLYGGPGNDLVKGLGGGDSLDGKGGDDTLHGGENKDTLTGGAGDDELWGDAGDDILELDGGRDRGFGGAGNDTLVARTVPGQAVANAFLDGGADNDFLRGAEGDDVLCGGRGQDTLIGGEGNDYLCGDMTATWVMADWSFSPPDAQNHYRFTNWSYVTDDGTVVPYPGDLGWYSSELGVGEDDLLSGGGNDWMHGGGDDTLDGGSGNDHLFGGLGMDIIDGGQGNDIPPLAKSPASESRVNWRSAQVFTGEPMIMRLFEPMPRGSFIHGVSRAQPIAETVNEETNAWNNSRWEHAA